MLLSSNYKNAYAVLNRHANRIRGPELSFAVHIWGGNPVHDRSAIHKHSSYWFGYVLAGQGRYISEEGVFPLTAGTIFCSRPHEWRHIVSERKMSLLWVSFDIEDADASRSAFSGVVARGFHSLTGAGNRIRSDAGNSPAAKLWEALWTQAEQFRPFDVPVLVSMAYALLLSLANMFGGTAANEETGESSDHKISSIVLRQAKWFLAENVAFPLKLDDVARQLHISGRHLSRLFKEEEGLPFSAYVRRQRVDKAKRELIESDKSMEQIARDCGFVSVYYFTRVFTAETGLPPGRYRRRNQS